MASDYDRIRADNLEEYGKGTRHLAFLGRLYTDRTHFIFELLQNAEDAGATKILFDVYPDRLEVRHDARLFDEKDVRGVCGVGEGTKEEDLTQIGKFGIGFKSVYAYTTSPQIHSGDEHFRIENYVRPYSTPPLEPGRGWTTVFVFRFDRPDVSPGVAAAELAKRLQQLSGRTLLFLHNLQEIQYRGQGGTAGTYMRATKRRGEAQEVTVIGQNDREEVDEIWLVFRRPVVGVQVDPERTGVEIAFKLAPASDGQPERVVKIDESPLVVYFDTEKQTRLGFLVQGPYRTTPSRDNVPQKDPWNMGLVAQTAALLATALEQLREMGLLTISLLETLPIRREDFPKESMFYRVAEKVAFLLKERELLPADDGAYVAGKYARLARGADLRSLLPHRHLRLLLGTSDPIKWLSWEITQDRTPILRSYVMSELGVSEIDPESFARSLSPEFLSQMDDAWFAAFYDYLMRQQALWRPGRFAGDRNEGPLRTKAFIRLEDGSLVPPFDKQGNPNAYLTASHDPRFPAVRRSIAADREARAFLVALGLSEPDVVAEVLNDTLPKYADGKLPPDDLAYLHDLEIIFAALHAASSEKQQKVVSEAKSRPFLRAINAGTAAAAMKKPEDLWFRTEDTHVYFEGNPEIYFIDEAIAARYRSELVELGACVEVMPRRRKPDYWGNVRIKHDFGYHKRGLKGFDPDASVPGLKFALEHPTVERSRFVWNKLLVPYYELLSGEFEEATRQDFSNGQSAYCWSRFGNEVWAHKWVPAVGSEWRTPREIRKDELLAEFKMSEALLRKLGVKPSLAEEAAQEASSRLSTAKVLGFTADELETLDLIKKYPDELAMLKERLLARETRPQPAEKPAFPARTSANPERREERVAEQYEQSSAKTYEQCEQSVRTSRNTVDPNVWLRSLYTNDDGQMVCQICKEEMPFRKRDGQYYFEAVEALSKDLLPREHEAQFLALCPVCAAMYKEFVKVDEAVMESLKTALLCAQQPEVPLKLGDLATTLQFVEVHFGDLRTVLSADEHAAESSSVTR